MSDDALVILLFRLLDTSIRWGLLIAGLAVWLAVRPPRRAATRHALCAAVLLAGPLLAVSPRWGDAAVPWPSRAVEPSRVTSPLPVREVPPSLPRPREPITEPVVEVEPAVSIASPAPPPPTPFDWSRIAVRTMVGVWLAGALMMLIRLSMGMWTLARWARRAVPATADDLATFAECRASLPTSRHVRLARHPEASSPVVVGGLRPTIVLPVSWCDRPAEQRRAALWHELAHVRRYDDAWKLLQESLRAPSWHHPMVHWLLGRLDRERELLCDEAAVSLGDDPKGLARLLLELSRRSARRLSPTASLPFLDRRTTAIRIERLLEDDMSRSLSRPSLLRSLTVGPLALAAALGLGGLNVRFSSASEAPPQAQAPAAAAAATDVFTGRVVDPQGRPVADVVGVETLPRPGGRLTVRTDADGRFALKGVDLRDHIHFLFWAPGYLPALGATPPFRSKHLPEWILRLEAATPFSGELVDERGEPLAGARVRLSQIAVVAMRENGEGGSSRFATINPDSSIPDTTATTADDGSFTLPYGSKDKRTEVRLEIRTRDGHAMIPRLEPNQRSTLHSPWMRGLVSVSTTTKTRITAIPSARIAGRVVSEVPTVDLALLRIRIRPSQNGMDGLDSGRARTVTVAADGVFAVDYLDADRVELQVDGPGRNQDWTAENLVNIRPVPGESITATPRLRRGVEVSGKVVERVSGRPLAGVLFALYEQPRTLLETSTGARTDAEGRYRLRMTPGRHVFGVDLRGDSLMLQLESRRDVTVPDDVDCFEAPVIEAPPYVVAHLRVVDADHRPVAGVKVDWRMSVVPFNSLRAIRGTTDGDGRIRVEDRMAKIHADEPSTVHVVPPGGEELKFQIQPEADGLVEVVLPPANAVEVVGSVVDSEKGKGLPDVVVVGRPGGAAATTDSEGHYRLRLAPGLARIVVQSTPEGFIALPGLGSETSTVVPQGVDPFEAPQLIVVQPTDGTQRLNRRLRRQ